MAEAQPFRTVFIDRDAPSSPKVGELIFWGKIVGDLGHGVRAGGSRGSLSFRTATGFVINSRSAAVKNLSRESFVEVIDCRGEGGDAVAFCKGSRRPSDDAFLHFRVYAQRRDVHAIFLGPDDLVLGKAPRLNIVEAAASAAGPLPRRKCMIVRGAGVLAVGRSCKEAGDRILRVHERAMRKP